MLEPSSNHLHRREYWYYHGFCYHLSSDLRAEDSKPDFEEEDNSWSYVQRWILVS
jgi:hypothetical protein